MLIKRHVFRADAVMEAPVFKIPNLRVSPRYVGERFVGLWNSAGLKGLDFQEVWSAS